MRRGLGVIVALAALIFAVSAPAFDNPASPVPASVATLKPQIITDSRAMLNYLKDKATPTDPQYYSAGVWHHANEAACGTCGLGPGVLAAALYAADGKKPSDLALATETLDAFIAAYAKPDGQFALTLNSPDTMFNLSDVGYTCYLLRGAFDAAHNAQCAAVLSKGSDWLVLSGNSTWYINGNINALELEVFYLTWLATGNIKYLTQYETELKFLISPPQSGQPKGFGLQYTTAPHRPDGVDGAAFLGEKGAGAPGYDPDYGDWQQSILARTYGVNRDARLLRITNMMFNQEWARTNHATFVLDATGGTRHSTLKPLYNGSLATIGWTAGREDVVALLSDQWRLAVVPTFLNNARDNLANPLVYRAYGTEVAQILVATMDERLR